HLQVFEDRQSRENLAALGRLRQAETDDIVRSHVGQINRAVNIRLKALGFLDTGHAYKSAKNGYLSDRLDSRAYAEHELRPSATRISPSPLDRLAIGSKDDLARTGAHDARNARERRRLARPVRADDRDDLAFVDGQRDAFEHFDDAVARAQFFDLEQRRH